MKLMQTLVAAALAASAIPALAGPLTLTFEGAESFASVGNFYGSMGVSFTDPAIAIQNDELGPYFSGNPSGDTTMGVVDAPSVMNVAGGMESYVKFFYSSDDRAEGAVKVYAGLDGTGPLLGEFTLGANAAGCTVDSPKCKWDMAEINFVGRAQSVVFSTGPALYDNVSINAVPEPSTYAMAIAGLAGLGLMARRRKS